MREQVPSGQAPLPPLFPVKTSAADSARAPQGSNEPRERRDWMERLLDELDRTPPSA